jgi:hypothetical protein
MVETPSDKVVDFDVLLVRRCCSLLAYLVRSFDMHQLCALAILHVR